MLNPRFMLQFPGHQLIEVRNGVCAVLICAFLIVGLIKPGPARADELSDRAAFWREKGSAYFCEVGPLKFPSKFSSGDSAHCDDGDMTLFNGLLCASGEQAGCQ